MSGFDNLVLADPPQPSAGKMRVWVAVVAAISMVLILFSALWERAARSEKSIAQQAYNKANAALAEVNRELADYSRLRSDMNDKHQKVETLIRSFRRPRMVPALHTGLVDAELSEVIVTATGKGVIYGTSYYLRVPEEGQAWWVSLKIGEPEFDKDKLYDSNESIWETEKVIVEPLVAKKRHVVRCGLTRDQTGTELQVTLDERPRYTRKMDGYQAESSSQDGLDSFSTFNELNVVPRELFWRGAKPPALDRIKQGVWLPIYRERFALHHRGEKHWRRAAIEFGLMSEGPLYLSTAGHFDYKPYLELKSTSRENFQEIIAVKEDE